MMSNSGTKKAPNYSYFEKLLVVELVGKYKDVIEDKKNNSATIQRKELAWDNIEAEFNARPQTSHRTKHQLKCFWKNEKMRAKEELISLWQTKGGKQSTVDTEELTELSKAVFELIPDKIRQLAENFYSLDNSVRLNKFEENIKQEVLIDDEESSEEESEKKGSVSQNSIHQSIPSPLTPAQPVPVTLTAVGSHQPLVFPRQQSSNSKYVCDYETFLRQIAEVEHQKKMENYQLKQEILLMKKRKLELELRNQEDLNYLQECMKKRGKFEQILDKT